jgi:hypothetical protein
MDSKHSHRKFVRCFQGGANDSLCYNPDVVLASQTKSFSNFHNKRCFFSRTVYRELENERKRYYIVRCSTLLYAALRCSTLLYAALRCSTLLYAALRCFMLLYAALHCATLSYAVLP